METLELDSSNLKQFMNYTIDEHTKGRKKKANDMAKDLEVDP